MQFSQEKVKLYLTRCSNVAFNVFIRHTSLVFAAGLMVVLAIGFFVFWRQALVTASQDFTARDVSIKEVHSALYERSLGLIKTSNRGSLPSRDVFR